MSGRQDIHNSDIPTLCRSCEARHHGMCGALTPDELVQFARATHKSHHGEGSELVAEGEPVTSYANVMEGVVKLTKLLEDGRRQVVGLQFAPDFLGRLFGGDSAVTAEAASAVELCAVPRPALERLIDASPALQRRLMQQTLRELDEARDWLLTLGRKTAREKVATLLLLIVTHGDPTAQATESASFVLPLTRADIADYLGLTIETVSRQLTRLRQAGLIRITNQRSIEVPDLAALRAACG